MTAFDSHRIGKFGDGRRCATDEELHEAGLTTEKKNVRLPVDGKEHFEEQDVWYDVLGREKVRTLFGGNNQNATLEVCIVQRGLTTGRMENWTSVQKNSPDLHSGVIVTVVRK